MAGEVEPEITVDFGERPAGRRHRAVMLGEPFQCFPRQVDAVEQRIGAFEARERAQRMAVVIEAAVRRHCGLQRILARVTEGRVADVVRERSEEHTSELQSLMRISYAVFCLKKKKNQ